MFKAIIYAVFSIVIFLFIFFFIKNQLELKKFDRSPSIHANKNIQNNSSEDPVKIDAISSGVNPVKAKITTKDNALEPEIKSALQAILNTSSVGLVEVKTDKGDMVDLKNRFRAVPVATINEKGEVVIQDYVSPPAN